MHSDAPIANGSACSEVIVVSHCVRKPPPATKRAIVAYLPLGSIVPEPNNPRKHPPEQIRAIARSIEAFGFNAPILLDKANRVVAGHGRLEAAKRLNLAEAPVIRLEHLSEQQAKAYMLADNKLTDRSSWDDRKVAIVLKELSDIALDFEIEATGFEPPEIDLRIQSLDSPDESTTPRTNLRPARVCPYRAQTTSGRLVTIASFVGALWTPMRMGCFSGKKKPSPFSRIPPIMSGSKGHVSGKGAKKHREFPMAAGELTEDEFCQFLLNAFDLMVTHSVDGATLFACMDWRHQLEIASAIRALGCELLNLCVWVKTNGGMGSLYRSRHELVFVFGKRGGARVNNVQLGKHGRNRTNVWNYPGMNSFARRGRTHGVSTFIRPSNPSRWSATRCSTSRSAATLFWIPFVAAARPSSPLSGRDDAAMQSSSIVAMWIPPSRAGSV
jgi:hypothetical protein